ncbi:hypothetical protein AGLY_002597 [Aphis glycines]|uniref:Uncharacterized protein n=1 Tax=Aphis glycines TaxID=307491 RepID=A0A6G0U378_APHGL|nr:hypothetical protein AGLY_002597 [Aphis glycines]
MTYRNQTTPTAAAAYSLSKSDFSPILPSNARLSVDHVNGVDRGLLSGGDRRTRPGGVLGGRFGFVVVLVVGFPPAVDAHEHAERHAGQAHADHGQPVRPEHLERRPLGLALEVGLVHARRTVPVAVAPQRGADARLQLGTSVGATQRGAVRARAKGRRPVVGDRPGAAAAVRRLRRRFGHFQPLERHRARVLGHELHHEAGVLLVVGYEVGPLVREHVQRVAAVVARLGRAHVAHQPDVRPDRVQQHPVPGSARRGRGRRSVHRQEAAPRLHEHAVAGPGLQQPRHVAAVQVVPRSRRIGDLDLAAGTADPLLARTGRPPENADVRVEVRVGKVVGHGQAGHAEPDFHAVRRRVERHLGGAERGFREVLTEAAALHAHRPPVHLADRQPGTAVAGRTCVLAGHRLDHGRRLGGPFARPERRVPHHHLQPVTGFGLQPVHAVQALGAAPAVQEHVPRFRQVQRFAHPPALDHALVAAGLAVVHGAVHELVVQPEPERFQHRAQHRVHLKYDAGRPRQVALVRRARPLRPRGVGLRRGRRDGDVLA